MRARVVSSKHVRTLVRAAALGAAFSALARVSIAGGAPDASVDASAPPVAPSASSIPPPSAGPDGGSARIPPDPPPLTEREQWIFDLRWDRGEVYLVSVQKQDMGAPRTTPRMMGRFALELYEGRTLVERVRFDFPMLGAEPPPDAGSKTPPRLEPRLRTRVGVLFPATKRGTRLELWDRATNQRWALPWPPKAAILPPQGPIDAGLR